MFTAADHALRAGSGVGARKRLKLAVEAADKALVAGDTAISIECLACGTVRAVAGSRIEDPGECGRCGYVGWTFADERDGRTEPSVASDLLARRTARPALAIVSSIALDPPALTCLWRELRAVRSRPA